jgi:Leu/Phe-tRNA-protein transferase
VKDNYGKNGKFPQRDEFHRIEAYPLRYTRSGMIFMSPEDDCNRVVDAMFKTGYSEEFCIALDWELDFIARLMKAGFLVMSETIQEQDEQGRIHSMDIVLPKLHLVRAALFFPDLHVKKSIKRYLSRYELRYDTDFDTIVHKCLAAHGEGWLTPSLINAIFILREQNNGLAKPVFPQPVSFGVYRDGELKAGEFGIICGNGRGRVYTSYSGYKEEDNSGTVQMILMAKWLEAAGFAFLDFGMPLDYKTELGARNISPEEFVRIFRAERYFPDKH